MTQLDSLRTLAFCSVAYSHWMPREYQFGLPFGMGVQLFFVLSGFLITGILLDYQRTVESSEHLTKADAFRVFYVRRCLRIWPLFYVTIGVSALLGIEPIRRSWPWHVGYFSNFYYYLSGSIDPFRHFWSLAVEEQFYLFWPAVLFLLPRTAVLRLAFALIILAPLFRMIAAASGQRANYLPLACFDSLGSGAFLAYWFRHPSELAWWNKYPRWPWALAWVCSVVLLFVLRSQGWRNAWVISLGHTLVVFFFAWLVYRCAAGSTGIFRWLLNHPLLIFLGQISYGLYVFHNLLTELELGPLFRYLSLPETWADLLVVRLFFQGGFTLLLALASWYCMERPINQMKRYFQLSVPSESKTRQSPHTNLSPP